MTINRTTPLPQLGLVGLIGITGLLSGCVGSSSNDSETFDITGMLIDMADHVIVPNYQQLASSTAALSSNDGALATYCAAIGTANEAAQKMAARQAWKDVMDHWQQTDAHRLGPVTNNSEELVNRIASTNADDCGVGRAVVLAQESDFDITTRSLNQRGLKVMEYLLFEESLDLTCPSQITELNGWNDRPEAERKAWRCDYVQIVAQDIADASATLSNAWDFDAGNYRSEFLNPANAATSLEAVSDAIVLFIDKTVKDSKLGVPLGISDDCRNTSCPDDVESPFAEYSLTNVRNNMVGFIQMLDHDGTSLSDLITDAGVPDLAADLKNNAQAAIDLIDTMDNTSLLAQATAINSADAELACANASANPNEASEQSACRLHGLVKKISDDLKVGFVAAVDVDLPDRAQSDND